MRDYYLPDAVRAAESPLIEAAPPDTVMRRAAYGLARVCAAELRSRTAGEAGRRVSVLVGSGDNGGDVLFAGAYLARRGIRVDAVLLSPERTHARALAAFRGAGGRIRDAAAVVPRSDLVVDGIVGISGRGALRPAAASVVAAVDAAHVPIVSADTPSGVDVVTGAVDGPAVTAAVTVAFGARKPVHALNPEHCGRVELIELGLAPALNSDEPYLRSYRAADVASRWPVPGPSDDKYSIGVLGVIAGSQTYPGAAVLAVGAAVYATSSMVRYVGSARSAVVAAWPEVIATDDLDGAGRVQAWAIGPGAGTDAAAAKRLSTVLESDVPALLDADALTLLAQHDHLKAAVKQRSAPTLLTPHAGEFERLTGVDPSSDRVRATRDLARELRATVLLKGFATVVADPDANTVVDTVGSAWAATPGSGDVLTGIVGKLLADGLPPSSAAACGTWVHSEAARVAADGAPTHASAIAAAVPRVLSTVLRDFSCD